MVAGFGPQLNVTVPPPVNAAFSAASVQLSGVPVPTTPAACAGVACSPAVKSRAQNTAAANGVLKYRRFNIQFPLGAMCNTMQTNTFYVPFLHNKPMAIGSDKSTIGPGTAPKNRPSTVSMEASTAITSPVPTGR